MIYCRQFFILCGVVLAFSSACNDNKDNSETGRDDKSLVKDTGNSIANPILKDTTSGTSIQWLDSTFKDIGTLKYKDSALISFRFKNTGEKPLIVKGVRATCGCTVADTLYKPVMPGKESAIKLKFYSEGQATAIHEKHVYVLTNTMPYPGTTLTFKVEVKD